MKTSQKKAIGIFISIVMILSILPSFAFAEERIPVEKIVVRLTSGSIDAPSYGDTVVHPTFEILSTEPAEAKDCYKTYDSGWYKGWSTYLREGDTFDEDTYRLFVLIGEKTKGAGDAYNLTRTVVYLLDNGEEKRLYGSASSNVNTFNYIDTYEVKAPNDIPPTIILPSIDDSYLINNRLFIQMQARGSKPVSWSAKGLPSGVSIDRNGLISGSPKQNGIFNVRVTATNQGGSETKSFPLHIKGVKPTVEVKSIIFDFSGSACLPVSGEPVLYPPLTIVSTEPAEAMGYVRVSAFWMDEDGRRLNASNHFVDGEYKFSVTAYGTANYVLADDCEVFFRSTPVTKNYFWNGELRGYIMFDTQLPTKPTTLSISGTYTFDGTYQSPTINGFDSSTMQLIDGVQKDAGTHTITVSPWNKWSDGTKTPITLDWTIEPFDISTEGVLEITTGVNKYTGYEQEVNIESVKATIGGVAYTLERGIDYTLGGTRTKWTNVGLAGTSQQQGFAIVGIGNYTGRSKNQPWMIDKGDPPPLEFIVEVPQTPGGKGAVIGTTADMVYMKPPQTINYKCDEGRTELAPGLYVVGKNETSNYEPVSEIIIIPEYDSANASSLAFDGEAIKASNMSASTAVCFVTLSDTNGAIIEIFSFAVAPGTIVSKSYDELGIATGGEAVVKAMLWKTLLSATPIAVAVAK